MAQTCERADQHSAKANTPLGELQYQAQSDWLGHDQMTFRDAEYSGSGSRAPPLRSAALIAILENYQQTDGTIVIPMRCMPQLRLFAILLGRCRKALQ